MIHDSTPQSLHLLKRLAGDFWNTIQDQTAVNYSVAIVASTLPTRVVVMAVVVLALLTMMIMMMLMMMLMMIMMMMIGQRSSQNPSLDLP